MAFNETNPVIASEARQSSAALPTLDCRASLAMTMLCNVKTL
jgi:hypothetical protein